MKKLVMGILISTLLFTAAPSNAMSLSAGFTTWYAWWDMPDTTMRIDNALLYGPALAFALTDDISLSTVFYYGKFDLEMDISTPVNPLDPLAGTTDFILTGDAKRYDSDTTMSYRINRYLKALAGFKYSQYDMTFNLSSAMSAMTGQSEVTSNMKGYGPAAGIGASYPVVDSLSITGSLTGLYMWTESTGSDGKTTNTNQYGYNASIGLSYYIEPASVTLNFGGRYQYFKATGSDNETESTTTDTISEGSDKTSFYGITASAIYTFSF